MSEIRWMCEMTQALREIRDLLKVPVELRWSGGEIRLDEEDDSLRESLAGDSSRRSMLGIEAIAEHLNRIRDLLRERLPERMAEAWTPESMVDDYTERPWSDDVRAADVVNDQDAEIARLREEVERRTEAQALAEALVLNHEAVIERLTRERDEARQLAQRKWEQDRLWLWKTADAATRAEKAESRERKLREALERFGDHLPGCAHFHDHIYPLPECSCGFDAALAAPPEEVTP